MSSPPFVSVVIPMRNEERYIGECLQALGSQDYPVDRYEILVVDGRSTDRSLAIAKDFSQGYKGTARLLDNPGLVTSEGLNIGVREASGDIVIILGAHTVPSADFVRQSVLALQRTGASCVGGTIQATGTTFWGRAIALVMSSPFGVGNALFRYSNRERNVDTVAYGAYRKEVFEQIGLFKRELLRNQDIEFNSRLRRRGATIFLTPAISIRYFTDPSLWKLCVKAFRNGLWNIRTWRIARGSLSVRHFVPLAFVASLLGTSVLSFFYPYGALLLAALGISYLLCALVFSLRLAAQHGLRYLVALPLAFLCLHLSYGSGSLLGLLEQGWSAKRPTGHVLGTSRQELGTVQPEPGSGDRLPCGGGGL